MPQDPQLAAASRSRGQVWDVLWSDHTYDTYELIWIHISSTPVFFCDPKFCRWCGNRVPFGHSVGWIPSGLKVIRAHWISHWRKTMANTRHHPSFGSELAYPEDQQKHNNISGCLSAPIEFTPLFSLKMPLGCTNPWSCPGKKMIGQPSTSTVGSQVNLGITSYQNRSSWKIILGLNASIYFKYLNICEKNGTTVELMFKLSSH